MAALPVLGIAGATLPTALPATSSVPKQAPTRSFADTLQSAMESVDSTQARADSKLAELASGQTPDIHGTMIAMEEADITLRTMVSIRDKAVDAYQAIMNMQI